MTIEQPDLRRLYAVPLARTTVQDPFWGAKLDLLRSVTLDDVFTKFEQGGAFDNFVR